MQLQAAVARQPVTIAIGVSGSREIQHYTGGIFSGYCPTRTDHAVVVVGYGVHNNRAYWLVKNSWGGHWGHAGYLYMARGREYGEGLCGLQLYPSYPIKRSANPASKAAASGEIPPQVSRCTCMSLGVFLSVDVNRNHYGIKVKTILR